jgi:hypothetical protein
LALRVFAILVFLGITGAALAAAGTAVGVDPDAEARGDSVRTLVVGADVFIGDRIVTDARGLVQIIFDDKTKLVVGPRSSLMIADYLRREDGSAGKLAVNALSGTFRFITGNSAKGKYLITTPTGQIGVRGTAFDFYVTKLATYILQLHGSTINCAKSGECETLGQVCEYGVMSSNDVETADRVSDLGNDDTKKAGTWFRYSKSQSPLLRQFRVSGAEKCLRPSRTNSGPDVPQSISDGPPVRRPPKSDTPDTDSPDSDGPIIQ